MARHARACIVSRNRGPAPADPVLLGILTTQDDFEELARHGGLRRPLRHPDYRSYLGELAESLERLSRIHPEVYGRRFHLGDLERYCADRGLEPGAPGSHGAYTEDPDGEPDWVLYTGQPLPEFLALLERARERGAVHRRLDQMLGETAEAAVTGVFPPELLKPAYGQAVETLCGMLIDAEPGRYRLACTVCPEEGGDPVEVCAELELGPGDRLRVEDADLDLLCAALCAAHALELGGRLVLCAADAGAARGWVFDGRAFHRRAAADLLHELSPALLGRLAARFEAL